MNISEGFIKRPIATSLLMAAIALFGLVAYRSLPVSDLPNVDFPTLLVTAQLPGAGPETMASSVATPLENQFSMIAGLESMTSVNSLGSTQITLEFDLNRSLDGAAQRLQLRNEPCVNDIFQILAAYRADAKSTVSGGLDESAGTKAGERLTDWRRPHIVTNIQLADPQFGFGRECPGQNIAMN